MNGPLRGGPILLDQPDEGPGRRRRAGRHAARPRRHRQPEVELALVKGIAVHIVRCIDRLKPLADRIILVDSQSTDATVALAEAAGAEVWQHEFVNHAAQFNWALDRLDAPADEWIVRIDADEWFEPAAIAALLARIASAVPDLAAFDLRRKVFFQGRWIRWGGYYRTILTRVWRSGAARIEQRWMDEHIIVEQGRIERITEGDLVDENLKDLTDWTTKHNGYTTRQMLEYIALEHPELQPQTPARGLLNANARTQRILRNQVYARAPLYLRAMLYFFQRYILRLGFLDGRRGLVFHTLQGFWNFFLADAKIGEARTMIAAHGLDHFRAHLAERHNIRLGPPA